MRIVFLDRGGFRNKPGEGGTSDTIWNLASQFVKLGDDVFVLGGYTSNDFPDPGVTVKVIQAPEWLWRNIAGVSVILALAWRQMRAIPDVDVIFMRDYLASGVFSFLERRIPVVLTAPGNVYQREALGISYYRPIDRLVYKMAARLTAKRAAHVIGTSNDMRDWWIYTGTSPLRTSVIPLGVRTDIFRPVKDARQHLQWNPAAQVLLYVGRLVTNIKGLDTLLKAAARLSQTNDRLEVHFVGDGPDRVPLEQLAQRLGIAERVFFHGWRPISDLPAHYSAADLCVLVSSTEPFGRTMLESMACGTPFMGPSIGGMADHIGDGVNGFLLEDVSTERLVERIQEALCDSAYRRTVGKSGRDYVLEHLSWEKVAERIRLEVFERVVRKDSVNVS